MESVAKADWSDLQCPWLRKIKLLLASGTGLRPDIQTELGGTPDNILPLLRSCDGPRAAPDHLKQMRMLWPLGINDIAQLTVPGTSMLTPWMSSPLPSMLMQSRKLPTHTC